MRKFVLSATLVTLGLAVLLAAAGFGLAAAGPFHPGDSLFPLQRFVELRRGEMIGNPSGRASYDLRILTRRIDDLQASRGTWAESPSLVELEDVLHAVAASLSAVQNGDARVLAERLGELLERANTLLAELELAPQSEPQAYQSLLAEVASLRQRVAGLAGTPVASQQPQGSQFWKVFLPLIPRGIDAQGAVVVDASIDPRMVLFPAGSAGAEHAFFPLIGEHSTLGCESCHSSGQFAGTPSLCSSCHEKDRPEGHYLAECVQCHTATSWREINFDHSAAAATNCQSCHLDESPANHYNGQCSACHSTRAWRPADFNHQVAGATNCQSCHRADRPANHYDGQCSACHNTTSWRAATFNHQAAGATDCKACHTRPANHFSGQCSQCHNTSGWRGATFDHSGLTDCQGCHTRPNNHYNGQCSQCHNTSGWAGATFSHAGLTDCQGCHTRPDNHYSGQCSQCHNTSGWSGATFSHAGLTDCQSCHTRPNNHYSGQCSQCHNTNGWSGATFSHSGLTDCQSCHTRPDNHWGGQCSQCHNTSGWGGVRVSGHRFPVDHGGANGECSACHNSTTAGYTCYNCHDRARMEEKHAEKSIFDIAGRCADCHPDGEGD